MYVTSLLKVVLLFVVLSLVCGFRSGGGFGFRQQRSLIKTSLACQKDGNKTTQKDMSEFDYRNKMFESLPTVLQDLVRWDKEVVDDIEAVQARNNQTETDSIDQIRKQREAEPYDMRLLGNLQRLFINEVVDPIMAMSQDVIADTPGGTANERSYESYLGLVDDYAADLFCRQNPSLYNDVMLRHSRSSYPYNVTERMERVDRVLYPLTGVKVLDLGLAIDAYRRHTMHAWEWMFTNCPASLALFVRECERCQWRDEWRDLGTKMTRAVRAKLDSNMFQSQKVYCDDPMYC